MIFQEYGVFPWLTVRGNIEFGLRLRANGRHAAQRAEIVERYLALMGLTDFADHYPEAPLGRHAPAPRARPRLRGPARVPAHGRAVRRARRADAHRHAGPAAAGARRPKARRCCSITHSVDEAIYLSSRIVVVTARPARVRTIIDVPFAYPRQRVGARGPPLRRAARADPRPGDGRVRGAGEAGRARAGRLIADPETDRPHAQQETTMTLRRRTLLQAGAAAGSRIARRLRRARLRAGAHQAARRLPAHARGRRPDLARPAVGRVDQARPRPGADPVHDRPRAVPGHDRRQPRRPLDRRRRLELPGARPGPRLPAQQHRVRDRAALGARRLRSSRSPT